MVKRDELLTYTMFAYTKNITAIVRQVDTLLFYGRYWMRKKAMRTSPP